MLRIAILGSGAGTTAAQLHRTVESIADAEVALVIGNNSGSGVLADARRLGLDSAHLSGRTHPDPADLDAAMLEALVRADVGLIILAGYMKKIGPQVLRHYDGRIVNTHPSLLPKYGGQGMYGDRVHQAVLADRETVTGASVHTVTAGYDEGPVLVQTQVAVRPGDDVESLRERVQAAERALLSSWLVDHCRRESTQSSSFHGQS